MIYALLAAGLVVMLLGGELLVRGAVAIARRLGVSPLLIGLTLVGFGTSTPELVACIDAVLVDAPGLAVGNVVGSNIANILLIMGVGAALSPMRITREAFLRDGPVLVATAAALVGACFLDVIGRGIAALFLALLVAYVVWTYRTERGDRGASAAVHAAEAEMRGRLPQRLWTSLLLAAAGLAGVLAGARLLVEAAIEVAELWGVSDAVIGLTVVAVGTSLPELATAVVAGFKRQTDVAFGNIIGSNIFNSLGIIGVTALVQPLAVPPEITRLDVWVMLGVALFGAGFALTGWRVSRAEGLALLLAYGAYLTVTLA